MKHEASAYQLLLNVSFENIMKYACYQHKIMITHF